MDRNYDKALKELLASEGGYTNEATDPGGPTNFGITIYDAHMYLNPVLSGKPPWNLYDINFMKRMKLEEAKSIYRAKYWKRLQCDLLPDGVDYSVFDYGVNSGVTRSARLLQELVGANPDGFIGPKTLDATTRYGDKINLIKAFNAKRLSFLRGLRHWPTYGRGWTTRVNKVNRISLNMLGQEA